MTLASMINLNEDALICDFAETYHIYDYRSLPVKLAATLSAGLRDDSRIKMSAADVRVSYDTLLLATIADRIEAFRYGFTKDAKEGTNQPESIVASILGEDDKRNKSGVMSFTSSEEFEATLARIRGE